MTRPKYRLLLPKRRLQTVSTVIKRSRFVGWLKWSQTVVSDMATVRITQTKLG